VITGARTVREDPVRRGERMMTVGIVLAMLAWVPLIAGLAFDHELWFLGLVPGSYSSHAIAYALRGRRLLRKVSRRSRR
jgi:hypothetical protein